MLRQIPDPPGIRTARTLPAAWYADAAHHEVERTHVLRATWMCAAVADDMPADGSWRSIDVAGVPVLFVRDRSGELRAFLNVCRHRASPLCEPGEVGSGPLIRCPYHSWLYRYDGSLARASGVGSPEGFDEDDFSLTPVPLQVWRRLVFVWVGSSEPSSFDLGPLAAAIDEFPLESLELAVIESNVRPFNWKVLLENYSENYHTPFVHPEIDTSSSDDYPMVADGPVLYAWDRKLQPGDDPVEQIMATCLPGEPGWEELASARSDAAYGVGSYLTIWPNVMMNVFPDAALVMWMEPLTASTTRVERRLYVSPGRSVGHIEHVVATHRLVHQQDVDICTAVQRSHDAGLDANGVLATVEERGVFFVHQHLRAALAGTVPD
ncbi:MAG: aromatic ring-hydroxylating dioxygenase subunit alpha [Actinobacteria bacterium]|nr:aromatic ring-hydroxylating dioxygenase subunit alpha [Actinomycetota bacterium]